MLTLKEKILLVKNDMLSRFPNCSYTIKILMWDDNTDMVECRYGDGIYIYSSIYYNSNLTFHKEKLYANICKVDMFGNEIQVMSPEEWDKHIHNN